MYRIYCKEESSIELIGVKYTLDEAEEYVEYAKELIGMYRENTKFSIYIVQGTVKDYIYGN